MERTIKFRVWNKISKRMLYDSSLAIKGNKIIEEVGFPVMQFTERVDFEGKELYDGDIVQFHKATTFGIIEWQDCGWVWKQINWKSIPLSSIKTNTIEIVGNKFQNPEMLKKEEKQ